MSHSIHPFSPSDPRVQPTPSTGADPVEPAQEISNALLPPEDGQGALIAGIGAPEKPAVEDPRFERALDQVFKLDDDTAWPNASGIEIDSDIPGLTPDEQQMILRYFPESPSAAMHFYMQDRSSKKVDPGALGARVDLRG